MVNATESSVIWCVTYLDIFFSSIPFLCSVAIKSVRGRDILNCNSIPRLANISGSYRKKSSYIKKIIIFSTTKQKLTWCVIGIRPNNLVAFVGPHSPLAQSGSGTITVCSSSQHIYQNKFIEPIFALF
jgi:hypothetical protein